ICDSTENCTGSSASCPADVFKASSVVCRGAAGTCDSPENCTGSSASCPTDAVKPNDTACTSDGNRCTRDVCDGVHTACQHPVTTCSVVTDSSLCTFDVDGDTTGNQFRLIYTPDQSASIWKLNGSNPGQYYFNVIYTGAGNTTVNVTVPYPFVTNG